MKHMSIWGNEILTKYLSVNIKGRRDYMGNEGRYTNVCRVWTERMLLNVLYNDMFLLME
jgi:hypothetical protein